MSMETESLGYGGLGGVSMECLMDRSEKPERSGQTRSNWSSEHRILGTVGTEYWSSEHTVHGTVSTEYLEQ